MRINRNSKANYKFAGLEAGVAFGSLTNPLVVGEAAFLSYDKIANEVVVTTFFAIMTTTDAALMKAFVDAVVGGQKVYADLKKAKEDLPTVVTLPTNMLLRSYEKETSTGVETLRHGGTFQTAFETALKAIAPNGDYDLAQAGQALNSALASATNKRIVPKKQVSVKNTRGQWTPFLDFDAD